MGELAVISVGQDTAGEAMASGAGDADGSVGTAVGSPGRLGRRLATNAAPSMQIALATKQAACSPSMNEALTTCPNAMPGAPGMWAAMARPAP